MNPSPHSSSKNDTSTKVSTIITILIYFITFLMKKKPPVVLASLTLVEIKTENAKVTTIRF